MDHQPAWTILDWKINRWRLWQFLPNFRTFNKKNQKQLNSVYWRELQHNPATSLSFSFALNFRNLMQYLKKPKIMFCFFIQFCYGFLLSIYLLFCTSKFCYIISILESSQEMANNKIVGKEFTILSLNLILIKLS